MFKKLKAALVSAMNSARRVVANLVGPFRPR